MEKFYRRGDEEQDPQKLEQAQQEAIMLNALVDADIVTRSSASNAKAEEVDRLLYSTQQSFLREQQRIEVLEREMEPSSKDGYLSDILTITVKTPDRTRNFVAVLKEYFSPEELAQIKAAAAEDSEKILTDPEYSAANRAIEYRYDSTPAFMLQLMEVESLPDTLTNCSHATLSVNSDGDEGVFKVVNELATGYREGYRGALERLQAEAERIKNEVREVMRREKTPDKIASALSGMALRGELPVEVQFVDLTVGQSHPQAKEAVFLDVKALAYTGIDNMVMLFAPRDNLRMVQAYHYKLSRLMGDMEFIKGLDEGIPPDTILQGTRIAEIGGDFARRYRQMGAEVVLQERSYDIGEFGGIKANEKQVTSNNFAEVFPGTYDVTMSRQVMDSGSGIDTGFRDDYEGAKDLLTAMAAMTRSGGVCINQGSVVPMDEEFLNKIGLELLITFQDNPDPIYLFGKR